MRAWKAILRILRHIAAPPSAVAASTYTAILFSLILFLHGCCCCKIFVSFFSEGGKEGAREISYDSLQSCTSKEREREKKRGEGEEEEKVEIIDKSNSRQTDRQTDRQTPDLLGIVSDRSTAVVRKRAAAAFNSLAFFPYFYFKIGIQLLLQEQQQHKAPDTDAKLRKSKGIQN